MQTIQFAVVLVISVSYTLAEYYQAYGTMIPAVRSLLA